MQTTNGNGVVTNYARRGVDILFFFVEANYEVGLSKFFAKDNWESKHRGVVLNAGVHIDF